MFPTENSNMCCLMMSAIRLCTIRLKLCGTGTIAKETKIRGKFQFQSSMQTFASSVLKTYLVVFSSGLWTTREKTVASKS